VAHLFQCRFIVAGEIAVDEETFDLHADARVPRTIVPACSNSAVISCGLRSSRTGRACVPTALAMPLPSDVNPTNAPGSWAAQAGRQLERRGDAADLLRRDDLVALRPEHLDALHAARDALDLAKERPDGGGRRLDLEHLLDLHDSPCPGTIAMSSRDQRDGARPHRPRSARVTHTPTISRR
jgi:hypothetical protein